jgi:sigma-E factor negative regulatory protein RseC
MMLGTRAIVVQVAGNKALVEAERGGGCGQCGGQGCGSSKLSQLFCVKPRHFEAINDAGASVGDAVLVEVQDGVVLQSALLLYGVPLLLLFAGALLGQRISGGDAGAAVGAAGGLLAGWLLGRLRARARLRANMASAVIRERA